MKVFIAAAIVFGIAVLAMAVGVIFANRRLRGSCGGLAGLRDEKGNVMCDACSTPSEECTGPDEAAQREAPREADESPNVEEPEVTPHAR